jgi:preprotein translocase subunit SecG
VTTFLLILHIFICFLLIFVVLVQGGKGAELGAAFGGGSSQTLFGGRGAATFLGKMTTVIAVAFMLTSLLLAIASVRRTSIIEKTMTPAERSTPPAQGGQLPTEIPAAQQQAPVQQQAPKAPAQPLN